MQAKGYPSEATNARDKRLIEYGDRTRDLVLFLTLVE